MLNIKFKVVNHLSSQGAEGRFVRLHTQLITKMAAYLRYCGTKNAVNRQSDYHYLGLCVNESTSPINGIDYIHPVVKPAVDYVTSVVVKGLIPNGELNFEFAPNDGNDDEAARQATEMVSKILNQDNDPHYILQRWVMDAALHKNGMLMALPQRETITRYVEIEGTTDQLKAFEQQAEDSGLTPLRQSRKAHRVDITQVLKETQQFLQNLPQAQHEANIQAIIDNMSKPEGEEEPAANVELEQGESVLNDSIARNTIHKAKYKLTGYNLNIKFRSIAQHYWICDPTVQEMKDQVFCGFYDPMTIQEATHLYPQIQDHMEDFRTYAEYNQTGVFQSGSVLNNLAIHARDSVPVIGIPVESGVGADPDSRLISIITVWDKYDIDGDGELELIKIVYSGSYIISAEEVEFIPVANMCPKPLPGNFYGMSIAESVVPMQEYMTSASRAEIALGLQTAVPRIGIKPDRVDFEMFQDGEAAIFVLDNKFDPTTDVYPLPMPSGNLQFIDAAMSRMQQDTMAIIGMTQPQDVFNPEIMAAGNSGQKLQLALTPNQIIQDNTVRNAADGLKELIYIIWRTLVQHGDDYGVKKLAQRFHPQGLAEFLDYKQWDDLNIFDRKLIHIELAVGMMSDENRIQRQTSIIQAQQQFGQLVATTISSGTLTPSLLKKLKKPFIDLLYIMGIKNSDTILPTDEEIMASAKQAQQQPPNPEALKTQSETALNNARAQEIASHLGGQSPKSQLDAAKAQQTMASTMGTDAQTKLSLLSLAKGHSANGVKA